MDNIGLSAEETQTLNEKFDMMLQVLTNFRKKLEENSEQSDKMESKLAKLEVDNKEAHNEYMNSLDSIISKFESVTKCIDRKIADIDNKISKLDYDNKENIDRIDRRITVLKSDNKEEHKKITKYLDSINSAFIKYETEGIDKLRILFDSDVDRKNHQDIYGHEFQRLNDLVAKNSFRISNLEEQFNNN